MSKSKPAPKKVKESLPAIQTRKVLVNGTQKQVFIIEGHTNRHAHADTKGVAAYRACVQAADLRSHTPCLFRF